ncbi:MAG: HlyD family efflux transporter periplasmic adaptor subunit [Bacteroidales bacterium]|nr:HlyD family efflux transporter periplasmic adaptor subunit [Bacteroidales bacterium]
MPITPEPNIDRRSEPMQEILGTPPRWIVRWGISIMLAVVLLVLVGSAFFRYPTMVQASACISTQNPPSLLVARSSGKMQRIFADNGQHVERGDTLAVIDNAANYRHMAQLATTLARLEAHPTWMQADTALLDTLCPHGRTLGDVQPAHTALAQALSDYRMFVRQRLHQLKLQALQAQLVAQQGHMALLNRQLRLALSDLGIARRQYARDSLLHAQGHIAPAELEQAQQGLIAKTQSTEGLRLSISNSRIAVEQLQQQLAEVQLDQQSQLQQHLTAVSAALNQLRTALAQWQRAYLLVAPSSGTLTHMTIWSDLQEVQAGSPVFAITPTDMGQVQVRMVISPQGVGRVRPGQRVNVRLDAYPYLEFGSVEATVHSVSAGPTETGFPAVALLTQGPVTTYGTPLDLERELTGLAEIATDEQSALQRLFGHLRYGLKQGLGGQ